MYCELAALLFAAGQWRPDKTREKQTYYKIFSRVRSKSVYCLPHVACLPASCCQFVQNVQLYLWTPLWRGSTEIYITTTGNLHIQPITRDLDWAGGGFTVRVTVGLQSDRRSKVTPEH